ncbi:MAG: hypothetical protein ACRCT1_02155 [Microcoleaceae cyanobacterium]
MSWITLRTASRWEAELMQQLLGAHDIPSRIVDLGIASYLGAGSATALQVLQQDESIALQLLMPLEDEYELSD